MPLHSPAPSPSEAGADVAIVAVSGRALAAAARRAGLRPFVFDLFGDEDTRELAAGLVRLRDGGCLSIDAADLLAQLALHLPDGLPLVLGTGFEAQPELVERLAARFHVVGNSRRTLTCLKSPGAFASLLAELGVPHPRLFATTAPEGVRTLEKQAGGSGGTHVRDAREVSADGRYLQEFVPGQSVSALFLGNGRTVRLIGFSEQWCAPAPHSPYRYGGAAGPIRLSPALEQEVGAALSAVAGATGLIGLASADLIVHTDRWSLLEINPRPGATLDLFDRLPLPPLLTLHLEACAGHLPELALADPEAWGTVHAAAFLYAHQRVEAGPDALPDWTADRPAPGTRIDTDDPVCTVFATGSTLSEARDLLAGRLIHLWHGLNAASRQAAE